MVLRKFFNFQGIFEKILPFAGHFWFFHPPRSSGRISFQRLGSRKDKDFMLEYTPMPDTVYNMVIILRRLACLWNNSTLYINIWYHYSSDHSIIIIEVIARTPLVRTPTSWAVNFHTSSAQRLLSSVGKKMWKRYQMILELFIINISRNRIVILLSRCF